MVATVSSTAIGCSQGPAEGNHRSVKEALGSTDLVISQVYGGGGNSGSEYKNDFIEIFNYSTSAVSVTGWSVQYASAAGSSWQVTNLSGTIQPGNYYLIQEATGGGGTTDLPTPDAMGSINLSAEAGKVALVRSTTKLTCGSSNNCVPDANIADFIGYGSTASSYEGSGPASGLSAWAADSRAGAGCTDTDDNSADFTAGTVAPRNSATPANTCVGGTDAGTDTGDDSNTGPDTGTSDGGLPTLPSPTLTPIAMSNLVFGAFGDVRPANPDDTQNYPDTIISTIFANMQANGVTLAVDAGDHCFQQNTSSGSYCHDQFVNHFMAAMNANYTGTLLPTLGNHEACGQGAATSGNCTSWTSGLIYDFLVDIVQPTTGQSSSPYYSVLIYGSWGTAKFVHVAANAWTSAQNTWLASTLNVPTTYTFVMRHEPSNDTRAPGVIPSESLYSSHYSAGTLTLSITGHTHLVQLPGGTLPYGDRYGATKPYEVILGNAGAPLDAGPYYGYAILTQRVRDGAIVTQAYQSVASDGTTSLNNVPDTNYLFAVNRDGSSNGDTTLP
jgi:hypothetical protein